MPKITFVEPDGSAKEFDANSGTSVMEIAIANGITKIEAECGGAMACATCHVYVDPHWFSKLEVRSEFESDMLEMADDDVRMESRLSCQIEITDALDGIRIELPG